MNTNLSCPKNRFSWFVVATGQALNSERTPLFAHPGPGPMQTATARHCASAPRAPGAGTGRRAVPPRRLLPPFSRLTPVHLDTSRQPRRRERHTEPCSESTGALPLGSGGTSRAGVHGGAPPELPTRTHGGPHGLQAARRPEGLPTDPGPPASLRGSGSPPTEGTRPSSPPPPSCREAAQVGPRFRGDSPE